MRLSSCLHSTVFYREERAMSKGMDKKKEVKKKPAKTTKEKKAAKVAKKNSK